MTKKNSKKKSVSKGKKRAKKPVLETIGTVYELDNRQPAEAQSFTSVEDISPAANQPSSESESAGLSLAVKIAIVAALAALVALVVVSA